MYCFISVKNLKCYCDGYCPDSHGNGTCETTGFCFAVVEIFEDEKTKVPEQEYSYGCMGPDANGGFLQVIINPLF